MLNLCQCSLVGCQLHYTGNLENQTLFPSLAFLIDYTLYTHPYDTAMQSMFTRLFLHLARYFMKYVYKYMHEERETDGTMEGPSNAKLEGRCLKPHLKIFHRYAIFQEARCKSATLTELAKFIYLPCTILPFSLDISCRRNYNVPFQQLEEPKQKKNKIQTANTSSAGCRFFKKFFCGVKCVPGIEKRMLVRE